MLWAASASLWRDFPGERAAAVPAGDPAGSVTRVVGHVWSILESPWRVPSVCGGWRRRPSVFSDGVMSPGYGLSVQAKEPETANSVLLLTSSWRTGWWWCRWQSCARPHSHVLTGSRGSGPSTQPRGAASVEDVGLPICYTCGTSWRERR